MPLLHRHHEPDIDLRERLEPYDRDRPAETERRDRSADTEHRDLAARDAGLAAGVGAPVAADERVSFTRHGAWNGLVRVLALAAAGVAVAMGVIALLRVDWGIGLDAPAVDVAGVAFTPWMAILTVAVGLVALAAAAAPDRGSKLVVGAILACVGIGILAVGDANRTDLDLERAHGWLALAVGAVLLLSGLLLRRSWTTRRRVRADRA